MHVPILSSYLDFATSFLLSLLYSIEASEIKKLQTLLVEVCGQLECIIFGDPAEEHMSRSFTGLAPDVVIILGPLSLLRVSHKSEVFYSPRSQRTIPT